MPVDSAMLLLFLATVSVFILTPGPNMIFCVSKSLLGGPAAGVYSALGVCLGLTVHATAAGLGLSQLFIHFPTLYEILRVGGAIYLIWLAWRSYRAGPMPGFGKDMDGAERPKRRVPVLGSMLQGMLNALLSPKAVFFYIVLFPQFLDPQTGSILVQSLFLITILNVLNFTVIATLCVFAGRSSQWLARHPRVAVWQQRLASSVFVGLAIRVLFSRPAGAAT